MSSVDSGQGNGNRAIEAAGGSGVGAVLVHVVKLLPVAYHDIALSAVPMLAIFSGYLFHNACQYAKVDWDQHHMNKAFDKEEQRLRALKGRANVSEDELAEIDAQLVDLQRMRGDAAISRIKRNIEAAPESTAG